MTGQATVRTPRRINGHVQATQVEGITPAIPTKPTPRIRVLFRYKAFYSCHRGLPGLANHEVPQKFWNEKMAWRNGLKGRLRICA